MTSLGAYITRIKFTDPSIGIGLITSGIPSVANPNIGVSKKNIEFTFTLDNMSIKFPYNESYFLKNEFSASNQLQFIFAMVAGDVLIILLIILSQ